MSKRILWLLSAAAVAAAQQATPPPTFQVGTKLVQVSVIAQDKQGNPVADLQREDFQILDNGAPQELRLFLAEKFDPSPPQPLPPNTFTNQIAPSAGSRGGYSVILIDNLITDFGDPMKVEGSSVAFERTLRMLRSIPLGERIAIYALQRKLQVICEFTSDRDLLEKQLRAWTMSPDTPGASTDILGDGTQSGDASDKMRIDAARVDMLQRSSASNAEMGLVADHLAGIPGRKNLIWLANRFVISPKAIQKLNDASVSVYPVDVAGVCRVCPPRPTVRMREIAEQTGGVAYYSRNDIDVALREAMDDGRVSYTLGFYASGDDRPPRVHQLAVRVSRPGVTLRARTSYETEGPPPASADPKADLVAALNRPIDATAITISASTTRAQDHLDLNATLDVASLDLTPSESRWVGKIKVVARFTAAGGNLVGEGLSQTLDLKLRQSTYDSMLHRGLAYHNQLKIPAHAVELKLLFANPASGKIGTLTIPLSSIEPPARN
jgi:VWFA-related protein